MGKQRDYYEALGVRRDASADEIRKAYRRLARTHHPDVNKDEGAADRFSEISEAYEVLNDPEKRRTYDQFGRAGVSAGAGGYQGSGWPGGGPGAGPDVADIGSIFEEMFGGRRGSPFGGGVHAPPTARKGRDLEHAITVTFLTAVRGGNERLRLGIPGHDGPKTIKVRIPPGTEDGARLRIRGSGEPSPSGGPAGDLILRITVGSHPVFRREGRDLYVDVPVTLAEAALGTSVTVPLLKGTAEMKIPPGASSGRKLRIKGKGITDASGTTGDFYAVVQIVAPEPLSDRAAGLLRDLAPELQNPRESGPWADVMGDGGS
jgi:curved DNA-binding protein